MLHQISQRLFCFVICSVIFVFVGCSSSEEGVNTNVDIQPKKQLPRVETHVQIGTSSEGEFPLVPDPLQVEWKGTFKLPDLAQITNFEYSSGHTPFLAFGFRGATFKSEVWNFASGQKLGEITDASTKSTNRSLSPDGTVIAFWNREQQKIEIWSYKSNQKIADVQLEKFGSFLLVSPHRLLVSIAEENGSEREYTLSVYDAESGELVVKKPTVTVLEDVVFLLSAKLSCNGRYLASFSPERGFRIFETETMRQVGTIPIEVLPKSGGGCSFSHDGTKLAAIASNQNTSIIYIASLQDGSVEQFSFPEPVSRLSGNGYAPPIEWLPNDSGWVIGGDTIVDWNFKRSVWKIDYGKKNFKRSVVLSGALIGSSAKKVASSKWPMPILQRIEWPQEEISAFAEKISSGNAVSLQPGSSVSVDVTVDAVVSANVQAVKNQLTDALFNRMRVMGVQKANASAADAVLLMTYSEEPGHWLQKSRSSMVAQPDGVETGVRSVKSNGHLEVQSPQSKDVLWSSDFIVNPRSLYMRGQSGADAIRQRVFEQVLNKLKAFPIPYYISDQLTLPGVTKVAD